MPRSTVSRDVLEAAARIVAREGPRAVTIERLARATGLSRATLYRRSGGRSAILDALAARGSDVGDRTRTPARILRGAREVFGRVGFEAAAMEEIAAAAKVSVVTVYRQFGDKEGLVAAFLDDLAPRRAVRDAGAGVTDDVQVDLEQLAERMLTGMRDDAAVVRLLILETLRGSPMLGRVRAKSPTRMVAVLAALLREHCDAGRLRDVDSHLLAQAFAGMVFAFGVVAPILRGEPATDPARTAKVITDLFLKGARTRRRNR
jgi:AcrR family transcriptional regulator